jgi:prevent-host-death family protein
MITDQGRWSIAAAKARFSRLISEAQGAPQTIERRGVAVAVVLSASTYGDLAHRVGESTPEARWRRFLDSSARVREEGGVELEIPRRRARPSPFGR